MALVRQGTRVATVTLVRQPRGMRSITLPAVVRVVQVVLEVPAASAAKVHGDGVLAVQGAQVAAEGLAALVATMATPAVPVIVALRAKMAWLATTGILVLAG